MKAYEILFPMLFVSYQLDIWFSWYSYSYYAFIDVDILDFLKYILFYFS